MTAGSQRDGSGKQHRCTVLVGQSLAAEGPSRTDEQVAGHADATCLGQRGIEGLKPGLAEPRELLVAVLVGTVGQRDGINLDTADACIAQQVELAHKLLAYDGIAVPPPAHEGTIAAVRVLKLGIQRLRRELARLIVGMHGHQRHGRQDQGKDNIFHNW